MRKLVFILTALWAPASGAEINLSLEYAENSALASSGEYKAALAEYGAAGAAAAAAGTALMPRIELEGTVKYSAVVSEIKTQFLTRPLGDNWTYSAGPSLYYNIYDGGAVSSAYKSASRMAEAKRYAAESARRKVLLSLRTSYFRLRLALEKVYLTGEDTRLKEARLADIDKAVKAGTRSRLDGIRARQEADSGRRDLIRARSGLSSALSDFSYVSGIKFSGDTSLPLDSRMRDGGFCETGNCLYIEAEDYAGLIKRFSGASVAGMGKSLPSVMTMAETALYWKNAAASRRAGLMRAAFSSMPPSASVSVIRPSLEDVFIRLVEGSDR